jgi:DNA polymerase III delta prime subunit
MATEPRLDDADKPSSGVTIGDVAGGIHDTVIAGRDVSIGQKITNFFLGNIEQRRELRDRRAMLELVKNTWVRGVLERSLCCEVLIDLGLEERADEVEQRPWDIMVQMPDRPNRTLPPGTKILDVFDEMDCALLILGEPGSGKTTTLLELARDLIARAEEDPTQPIPVVFNLASWADRSPKTDKARKGKEYSLTDWLTYELIDIYKVPQKVARTWVENDELLLLLDGLDEVKPESREACVQAINDFRAGHGFAPLVVCSRIADYEALATKLMLQSAVLLQPLTPRQVDEHLERAGTELAVARQVLRYDTALQELARSPLMLSIMTLAYRGVPTAAIVGEQVGSVEARREHLFDVYVQQMFHRVGRSKRNLYPQAQTKHWLTWLAQKMIEHRQSVFLLEQMQRSWLSTPPQQRRYGVISGLVLGLICGLGLTLALGFAIGLPSGLALGLVWGLRLGQFETEEIVGVTRWSWKMAWIGLVGGLLGGALLVPHLGLTNGTYVGLILGLVGWVVGGLISTKVRTRTTPDQGIRDAIKNAAAIWLVSILTLGLLGGLCFGLLDAVVGWLRSEILFHRPRIELFGALSGLFDFDKLLNWLVDGLVIGQVLGTFLGVQFGGWGVIHHYTLRFILCRSGYIPWNYVGFLDYADERILLRKVGGGYIFVHRLLMEYFASLEPEQPK